jgi:hypothetical protein
MPPQKKNPKLSSKPVTGVARPSRADREKAAKDVPHHLYWDRALSDALENIGRPRGLYSVAVQFTAVVDVTNPGGIIEYQATII